MGGTTLLLREAEREPAIVRQIASSPPAEAHLSKRAGLMLLWELGRLAEPISDLWNGRAAAAHELAATRRPLREAKRQPLIEDYDVCPRDCVPTHGRVRACSRSTAPQTATIAVGLELGSHDGFDGTMASTTRDRASPATRTTAFAVSPPRLARLQRRRSGRPGSGRAWYARTRIWRRAGRSPPCFAQPSFPDCTGIVQTKRSLPDRAESSSLAESAASATNRKRAESGARPDRGACLRGPEPDIGDATCLQGCVNSVLC